MFENGCWQAGRAILLRAFGPLGGGRAVASHYEIFCWPQPCLQKTLATAAAICLIDASPFNCATLTQGCSATPTPLTGCPLLPAGTAPPQHCWSCHAAILFSTLLSATCYKGAGYSSSHLLWAPGFGGQQFGQHHHLQPECTVVPRHSSCSMAAVLIVCSRLLACLAWLASSVAQWVANGQCQGTPAANAGAGAVLLQTSTLRE
jgi:hypothetical protein